LFDDGGRLFTARVDGCNFLKGESGPLSTSTTTSSQRQLILSCFICVQIFQSSATMSRSLVSRSSTSCWRALLKESQPQKQPRRTLVALSTAVPEKLAIPPRLPEQYWSQLPIRFRPNNGKGIQCDEQGVTFAKIKCRKTKNNNPRSSSIHGPNLQRPRILHQSVTIITSRSHRRANEAVRQDQQRPSEARRHSAGNIHVRRISIRRDPINKRCSTTHLGTVTEQPHRCWT
jgi:hypothetical protein